MSYYNKIRSFCCVCMFMCATFASIHIEESYAIENLHQWWSTEFDFNSPGARSRGMGGAFVGRADDGTASIANPAGLAQLPSIQLYVEGHLNTWDSREAAWPHDPLSPDIGGPVEPIINPGGPPVVTTQEGKINFEDMLDLAFASVAFPFKVGFGEKKIGFNAAVFYNKIANSDVDMVLPMTFQSNPGFIAAGLPFTPLEGYISNLNFDIDEYGVSLAKSFFGEKLMIGGTVSVMHLDLETTWRSTYTDSAGVDHEEVPGNAGPYPWANQFAETNETDLQVAFRAGILYRFTDKLLIGFSAQVMPQFSYETDYISLVDSASATLPPFTVNNRLSIPDVYSIGASYQLTDNWGWFIEGKHIKYSDLMDDFTSGEGLWGADINSFNEDQFEIDNVWESHLGTEYIMNIKSVPLALRLGTYSEPAHSLEYRKVESPGTLFPRVGDNYADLMDGGDDVLHFTAGAGVVIKSRLQIDAALDIQDDGNASSYIMSIAYEVN